ncbi:methionyl-tRNA formyltransferase [Bizionia sediminis]|uniref:Methionyl-tRNA formyltransferase n=1 Tax=Bizionia sediminis TaxID=1737064 RepID=A0ABW5KX69_9FLAO
MKITLYLMTQKGFNVLNALINKKLTPVISEIIVGRDKNIDNDFANEIISICNQNNINYKERHESFKITSNYSIAISWRWLIPDNKSKLIVLHDSLLPKYRGFAPLVNMLCNKEKEIGVTAIFASDEYDKGDIIAQASTRIKYPIKISKAIDLIAENYVEVVLNIFSVLEKGNELVAVKQDENKASYSLWRDEEDYRINWEKHSDDILNFINAVSSPYKGASTYINGKQKVRILEAELESDVEIENRDVGKVIFLKNKFPVIVCGSGLLKLLKVIDDKTQENLLPLKNFRIRLTDQNHIYKK